MNVSIIIPTYNRSKLLKATIDSLVKQNFYKDKFEVLIVDNGSTDDTKKLAEASIRKYDKYVIRYIYEPVPGLLAGRHRGAAEANSDILVFVDDDIEADPGWLSAIYRTFEGTEVFLVGGKSLPKYEIEPPFWVESLWNRGKDYNICGYYSLLELGDKEIEIDPNYVWGLNFSIRKKTLFELGGFHPDCVPKKLQRFQGDGETGLTRNFKAKGYKAIYQPSALVYHFISKERLTLEYLEQRQFYQGVANSYSNIRTEKYNNSKLYKKSKLISKGLYISKIILTNPLLMLRKLQNRISKSFNLKIRELYGRMKKAYQDGYNFHQNEVKNDPELLEWVFKEDYFDYTIPYKGDIERNAKNSQN